MIYSVYSKILACLGVLSSRPRNQAQRFPGHTIAVDNRYVSERQDTHEALVTIDDRQTPDLDHPHIEGHLLKVLVVEAVLDVRRHDVAHTGRWALALRNAANGDIAVGNHADE